MCVTAIVLESESPMSTEVSVSSTLTTPSVILRAMIANNSSKSQMSGRLAQTLGLMRSARAAYASDVDFFLQITAGDKPWVGKWKISVQPVIVTDRETQRSKGFGFLEFASSACDA